MKIAVIGSGISGLTAAYLLSRHHEVTVFEADNRLGGHTATIPIEVNRESLNIDTGFIVYNDWTYPNFIKLLEEIGIPGQPTEMGFSVTTSDHEFEYCGSSLSTLFVQKKHWFSPAFYRMLKDIVHFNRQAKADLSYGKINPETRLIDYLDQYNYGNLFTDYYIIPMASAIWSCSGRTVHDFQALFFIRFFYNHGLLNINQRPQWYTIKGGSNNYIPSLTASFKDNIHLNSPVTRIKRHPDHVDIETRDGSHRADYVVIATHSDQALSMLDCPSDAEQSILGAIRYSENSVIMHTDTRLLPTARKAWASWNYLMDGTMQEQPVLTYHMNTLQNLDCKTDILVTVNGDKHINEEEILKRFTYAHPQLTHRSIAAQRRWREINNWNRTLYCGAYWGNGFHEDGVVSAKKAAASIGVKW